MIQVIIIVNWLIMDMRSSTSISSKVGVLMFTVITLVLTLGEIIILIVIRDHWRCQHRQARHV